MSGAFGAGAAAEPAAEAFELSQQQRRAWSLRAAGSELVVQCALRVEGGLDDARLEAALADAVGRHEILRTRFVRHAGLELPFQMVDPRTRIAPRVAGGESVAAILAAGRAPFDLERGPLLRVTRASREDGSSLLVMTLAALCGDPRTLDLLADQLLAGHEGRPAPLDAPEPLQYADFASWQREILLTEDEDHRRAREHWGRLSGARVADLGLPGEPGPSERLPFAPRTRWLALEGSTVSAALDLAERWKVPPESLLLGCWAALLGRRTAAGELVVGALSDGRSFDELGDGLGPFARYLPLAWRPDEGLRWRDLVDAVASEERLARGWQDYAFLAAEVDDAPTLGRLPFLFEVDRRAGALSTGRLVYSVAERVSHLEPFKLKLTVVVGAEGLRLGLHHDSALYSDRQAERLAGQLAALLESVVAEPDARVGACESLAPEERRLLIDELDRTAAPGKPPEPFHRWFEARAREAPDRRAVVAGARTVTFAELDLRANRLARHLRELGLGVEDRAALLLPRTPDMLVALLAVLKAGSAYVPLDPAFPAERIASMLEDAEVSVALTVEPLAGSLPGTAPPLVLLDRDRLAIERRSGEPLEDRPVDPATLMYVVFTSGSTGRPKGVGVEHRQVDGYLRGVSDRLGLGAWAEGATLAFLSTFAADLGNTALLPALGLGGCLHLLPAEDAADPAALAAAFRRHPVDCLKIVPSHLAALLLAEEGADLLPTRCLVLGGEAAGGELLARVREAAPELEVFNHYGPTETTVGVLAGRVDPDDGIGASGSPYLGRPLSGARVHLLNRELRPVPAEVVGEIYVGGRGVARGYLGRPAATACRFLPDPWSTAPGARLYATGDRGRFSREGELEFIGRADGQVKLRGNRIELGEIEAVLSGHPDVREAAVKLGTSPGIGDRILAYVVPRKGAEPEAEGLRQYLRARLPEYMVPAALVSLESLPLTATGKVDRNALPAPDEPRSRGRRAVSAPRSLLELELVQIWEELLGLRPLGTDENFFALGGHSLLAVRLMARIERRLGRALPLATLYRTPTVAELASELETGPEAAAPSPLVAIQGGEGRPPFFCVHPMGGEVLCYYHLSRALGADQPFYGLQARGLRGEGTEPTLEEMAARYVEAVVEVQPRGPYLLGGYSFGSKVAFEMAHQLRRQGRRVALLALLDGGAPGKRAQLDTLDEGVVVAQAFREEARQKGEEFPVSLAAVLELEPDRRLEFVVGKARDHGFLPPEVGVEMVREYARGVRDRQRASERYVPEVYPGPVTYIRSTEQDEEFLSILETAGYDVSSATKGWERFVAPPIEIHEVPGMHETLLVPPSVEDLAAVLRASIDCALEATGP